MRQTDLAARTMPHLDGRPEGARSADGRIEGSYVHGLFTDDGYRRAWLARHGLGAGAAALPDYHAAVEAALDAVADTLEASLDVERLLALARPPRARRSR